MASWRRITDIPPGSSDICKAEVEGNAPVFRVVAITSGGRKLKDAGVCPMYEMRPFSGLVVD